MRDLSVTQVCEILEPLRALEVSDFNGLFQTLLASRLLEAGRPVPSMTIDEVSRIIQSASAEFNESQKG